MSDLILDVGANAGEFSLDIAERNPTTVVLAIEPIPHLVAAIDASSAARGLTNVRVLQAAIDQVTRTAVFHLAEHADQGVSSLLEFDAPRITQDEYWRERGDLYFDRSIEVQVQRLDQVPEVVAADRIRFIKIDAQGVDLQALESLGAYLPKVEAGMLEVPATLETRLYAAEAYDLHLATNRLLALGFRVYGIKPNDHACNEFNLFFCRPDIDPGAQERALRLRGIHLYDGKHYWHSPSNTLQTTEALTDLQRVTDRMAELEGRLNTVEAALGRETAETARLNAAIAVRDAQIRSLMLAIPHRG